MKAQRAAIRGVSEPKTMFFDLSPDPNQRICFMAGSISSFKDRSRDYIFKNKERLLRIMTVTQQANVNSPRMLHAFGGLSY